MMRRERGREREREGGREREREGDEINTMLLCTDIFFVF